MLLIKHEKYNTHVKREVEFSSQEISMTKKVPNQQSVEIRPIPFHNHDLINYQIENTGKSLVALQPTSLLHSVVYPISESNPPTPFNLLILFKFKKVMGDE